MLKHFFFQLLVRVLLLLVTLCTFAFIFGDQRLIFNHLILGAIIIIQVIELTYFVNRTNRELSRLFFSLKHQDFTVSFKTTKPDRMFQELQSNLGDVIKAFRDVKIEKESQYHLLQMLVQQIHVGILVIENNEHIILINPLAERWFQLNGLTSWRLAQQQNSSLVIETTKLGEQGKKLVEIKSMDETTFVTLTVNTLLTENKSLKIITCQNIDSEVEQKEIEAWQKLIRILTHEIMNSITPISSLTETMQSMLESKEGDKKELQELTAENIQDFRFSLKTIHNRSNRLLDFVDAYRQYTRTPKPRIERVAISELFESIEQLMVPELKSKAITFTLSLDPDVPFFELDNTLIEQVIINLITNSIGALEGIPNPQIHVSTYRNASKFIVEVRDNGKGIAEKDLSSIFIPFFSTKNNGSGIGLSLSKQIIQSHGGKITVKSIPGKGTSFFLQFNIPAHY